MLISAYSGMGGKWMQVKVVGKETLIEAQESSEKYEKLVVRVAGYSVYFMDMGKEVKNNIIRRTELNW